MLPAPDQSSARDAHVAVADPDTAHHPEDSTLADVQPAADLSSGPQSAAALSASASGSSAAAKAPEDGEQDAEAAEEAEQRVWQAQPILLDVQKECFSRLLLLPEILTDHLPDTYLAAVQQL